MNPQTGLYDGLNCHGEEKVRRMRELYPDAEIEQFYSDSLHDTPLARLARRSTPDELIAALRAAR